MVTTGPSMLPELAVHDTEELLNTLIDPDILSTLHNEVV